MSFGCVAVRAVDVIGMRVAQTLKVLGNTNTKSSLLYSHPSPYRYSTSVEVDFHHSVFDGIIKSAPPKSRG